MSAAKKKSPPPADTNVLRRISGWFSGLTGKLFLFLVMVGIFIAGVYAAWQKISHRVLIAPEYAIGPQQIEITAPPPWINRTDLRMEVFQDLSRQGPLSIMDDDLTERVNTALLRQPWVKKVSQVSKQNPAKVKVDLEYRRPVCMVETPGVLIPVDVEGTLLPMEDFSPVEKSKYPKLRGVDRAPMGRVGTRWGDGRVAGGAEIANELLPLWEKMKLEYIIARLPQAETVGSMPQQGTARRMDDYFFEINAHGGMRILWGHSAADNRWGEPTPQQKTKKLEQFFGEKGSLDYPQRPAVLDLRQ